MTMVSSPRRDGARPLAWRRYTLRCVTVSLAAALPCSAQSDTATRIPPHLCWRGKPAPHCSTFWITEFGVDVSTSSTQTVISDNFGGNVYRYAQRDFESRFIWTVGPMFNTRPRTAIGGTLSISPLSSAYRTALEARRRWWTAEGVALDLSAGALRMAENTDPPSRHDEYGLTAGALVVGEDLITVNGRIDLLLSGRRRRLGTSLGFGGGSYVALAGTVALGLLVLAILSGGPWD